MLGERLVTIGLGFWPGRTRSSILVSASEHRWFDIAESAIPIADYVVAGLTGPIDPPEMTFGRFVVAADYAMRSVLDGRATVELQVDDHADGAGVARWRASGVEMRLTPIGNYRLRATASTTNEDLRNDWYLQIGDCCAVRCYRPF